MVLRKLLRGCKNVVSVLAFIEKQAIINDFNRFLAPTIEIVGLVF
jgi:hypothetical protein